MDNSIDDFYSRFTDLAKEASGYGIKTIFALGSEDPISTKIEHVYGYSGNWMECLGLNLLQLKDMERQLPNSSSV